MEFHILETPTVTVKTLAEVIAKQLHRVHGTVVLPSGTDANIFYPEFARCINETRVDMTDVLFLQGEELCPLPEFHPISFAYQIQSRFVEHLSQTPNIFYLATRDNSVETTVRVVAERAADITPQVAIVGINDSGDVLGMTPILFSNNAAVNAILLTAAKWEAYLKKNGFFEAFHDIPPPHLISLGAPLLRKAEQLYVLSTGPQKRLAIDDVRKKVYASTIGKLVQERQQHGLDSAFYVDHIACEN